ncbi:MAG: hypothetical protein ACNI25_00425 [Halarcobacter sp.]
MDTNFSSILDKFKEGANSMEEVYKELSHLTSNYDEELGILKKQITELTIIAENEEAKRHEAEDNLADLKKLQQINFSTIIDELIRKPRENMQNELKKSTKKFLFTAIISTIISIAVITSVVLFFLYSSKSNSLNVKENNSQAYKELINKIDNLEKSIQHLKNTKKPAIEKNNAVKKDEKNIQEKEKTNEKPKNDVDKKEENINSAMPVEKEKVLEKVATHIKNFDSQFKLNSKNRTRLLYKMNLLDFAPIKYEDLIQEIELFAREDTYIPSEADMKVWDKQMLEIYKKMLTKIQNLPNNKIDDSMTVFENYKDNDATYYGNWQYAGEKDIPLKQSLKKEIKRVKSQIELNTL